MGSSRADFGGILGSLWGVRGRSEGGRGGHPEADFFFHFVKFKIMKLCGGFSLLLKRLEVMLNEFFDDFFFLDIDFIGFFRELYIRKFREFVSDDFYDKK